MSKLTKPQLTCLRSRANCTGQRFTCPQTFNEASSEIDRLKGVPSQARVERRDERKLIADQVAIGLNNTSVAPDETTGYGSNCRWLR